MTPARDVEVVIPAYNAERTIGEALDSVAAQTVPPERVIVVDDGSSDATAAKVRSFAASHPGLEVLCLQQANAGLAAARNRGLELARATFVALLDADDAWLPQKLERQLALFERPGAERLGLVYCDFSLMSEEGAPLADDEFELDPRVRGEVYQRLLHGNAVAGSASAVLIRRACLARVGLFDETLVSAEDWDLWLRLARHYEFDFVPEPLVRLRRHPANMQKDESRMRAGELRVIDKLYCAGEMRWQHLWRLRARLAHGGIDAAQLARFGECHPNIRAALTGWRMALIAPVLRLAYCARGLARAALKRRAPHSQ